MFKQNVHKQQLRNISSNERRAVDTLNLDSLQETNGVANVPRSEPEKLPHVGYKKENRSKLVFTKYLVTSTNTSNLLLLQHLYTHWAALV